MACGCGQPGAGYVHRYQLRRKGEPAREYETQSEANRERDRRGGGVVIQVTKRIKETA